jgi:adenylate cyclase
MVGTTVSHYKILKYLGGGGMGVVYKAQDLKLDRFVALKFLPPELTRDPEAKKRFVYEAKAASALQHNSICTIHDIDQTDDSRMFIVMDLYEGDSLKKKIEGGPLKLEEGLDIAVQVAQGLAKAHEHRIIHRDIKPANVMVTKDGVAKIVDFGLAKLVGQSKITKTGSTVGTVAYMSPEQIQGLDMDERSDIWSLGAVLYESLTGELPFKAEHEAGWIYVILNEEPLAPSALDRKIPHSLDSALMRMLRKDRAQRYQSMGDVIKMLQEIRSDQEMAALAGRTKTIAVLPFENISPDKESDYFSDGLTEELIVNLSRLKDMKVIARTTTMQYKATKKDIKTIGRELGARYIIEGSVRKFQDNLRITAELIEVESGTQLWAESYKGKLADVFDIQEQVAKQIVDALMVKLTPSEKVVLTKRATLNAEAFDCNLRARNCLYQRTKKSIQVAIQLFQKATHLDPRYAAAYAGTAEAYATLYQDFDRKEPYLDKAIESSLKALMYDASLPEAYAALGLAYFNKDSLEEGTEASRKAIELDPNNFVGYWILGRIYHTTDHDGEAAEMFQKVIALNPDFYSAYGDLEMMYQRLGEKEKFDQTIQLAIQVYRRYLAQHPDDARGHMYLAVDLAQIGDVREAKAEAEKALALSPDDPLMLYNATCFYAQMGEKRLALETLRSALAAGYGNFEWLKRDPDLDTIRNDPEYVELLKGK